MSASCVILPESLCACVRVSFFCDSAGGHPCFQSCSVCVTQSQLSVS